MEINERSAPTIFLRPRLAYMVALVPEAQNLDAYGAFHNGINLILDVCMPYQYQHK